MQNPKNSWGSGLHLHLNRVPAQTLCQSITLNLSVLRSTTGLNTAVRSDEASQRPLRMGPHDTAGPHVLPSTRIMRAAARTHTQPKASMCDSSAEAAPTDSSCTKTHQQHADHSMQQMVQLLAAAATAHTSCGSSAAALQHHPNLTLHTVQQPKIAAAMHSAVFLYTYGACDAHPHTRHAAGMQACQDN